MRHLLVVLVAMLSTSCDVGRRPIPRHGEQYLTGESAMIQDFRNAQEETDVPAPLLAAISHRTSFFYMLEGGPGIAPESEPRCGITQFPKSQLEKIAEIMEIDPGLICEEPSFNTRAAAILLKQLHNNDSTYTLEGWREALDAFGGYKFTREVHSILSKGVSATDENGRLIVIEPWPDFLPKTETEDFALQPDYPDAEWIPAHSSNYWNRNRGPNDISHIVIHVAEGYYNGTISHFRNSTTNVSAHFVISRNGDIAQMVEIEDAAWHAGCYNDFSIGIEHEGFVDHPDDWFTPAMYQASADLVTWLSENYGIPANRDHIVGHSEIGVCNHNGHTDPGNGWDWDYYMDLIDGDNDHGVAPEDELRIDSVNCNSNILGDRTSCRVEGQFAEGPGEAVDRLWIGCLSNIHARVANNDPNEIRVEGRWNCECDPGWQDAAYAMPGSPQHMSCNDPRKACLQQAIQINDGCDNQACGENPCGDSCGDCGDDPVMMEDCDNNADDDQDGLVDCSDPNCYMEDPDCSPSIESVGCTTWVRGEIATCEMRGSNFAEDRGELVTRAWIGCLNISEARVDDHNANIININGVWECGCPHAGWQDAAYAIPGSPQNAPCDAPYKACLSQAVFMGHGCEEMECGTNSCGELCAPCDGEGIVIGHPFDDPEDRVVTCDPDCHCDPDDPDNCRTPHRNFDIDCIIGESVGAIFNNISLFR